MHPWKFACGGFLLCEATSRASAIVGHARWVGGTFGTRRAPGRCKTAAIGQARGTLDYGSTITTSDFLCRVKFFIAGQLALR